MKSVSFEKILCVLMLFLSGIYCEAFSQDSTEIQQIANEFMVEPPDPKPLNLKEVRSAIMHRMSESGACIEGKLIVRVLFDVQGNYVKHIVLTSPHSIFTKAVEAELPCLRIEPMQEGGKPFAVWVTFPFRFLPNSGRAD